MLRSLYSAVSGLDVNQKSMDIIGNNIANVNTFGFKEGRAVFQDLMSQTLIGGKTPTDARGGINPRQVGMGAYLAGVDNIFEPGPLKATNKTTDLAIEGNGFFVVRGEGQLQHFYTRAGDFNFDRSGTLTNPSGYKVQGWMSDPVSGDLLSDVRAGDIVLGPQHQILQAKSTSKIDLAGVLDTRATASELKYPMFLTQATGQQDLTQLTNKGGVGLDLAKGEPVRIKAHATLNTVMSELFDKSDTSVGLKDGNQVTFSITDKTPVTLTFKELSPDTSKGEFNTVEQFIEALNGVGTPANPATYFAGLAGDAKVSIQEGQFVVQGQNNFTISGISGNSQLVSLLQGMQGAYTTGTTKASGDMFYVKEVKAGENFNNLSELAIQVESALAGKVVNGGFKVEFLENNFGLKHGEKVTLPFTWDDAGTTVTSSVTLTYSETPGSTGVNKGFNTVSEFAAQLSEKISDTTKWDTPPAAGTAAVTNPARVVPTVMGEKFSLTWSSGLDIKFGAVTAQGAISNTTPSPYFQNLLNGSIGSKTIGGSAAANKVLNVDDISGKGRLVYSYTPTVENVFGIKDGDTIAYNGANATYTKDPTKTDFQNLEDFVTVLVPGASVNIDGSVTFPAGTVTADGGAGPDFGVFSPKNNASLAKLNSTLNPTNSGANVPLAAAMTINFSRVESITGFSIDKAHSGKIFEDNVLEGNGSLVKAGSSAKSGQFLTKADENAKIIDLFSASGESFNFNEGDSFNFKSSIGGTPVTNNDVFGIEVNKTVRDLMFEMEEFLGLGKEHNSKENVLMKDGRIVVNGEKGKANNIDFFTLNGASSKFGVFNNYMTSEVKSATGGTLATNMTIYDEQGNPHVVNFNFTLWNEEQNEWKVDVSTDNEGNSVAINGATKNELVMKFNTDGSLSYMYDRFPDPATIMVNPTLRFSAANGTNTIPNIALNLGTQGGVDGMMLSAAPGAFTRNSNDGYPQGTLDQPMFNPAGEIVGTYSNGQVRVIGQLSLATFVNQQGLLKVGDTMFAETGNSGQATLGKPQTGSRGDIVAGMLENSNVDLSREFVSMITTQRGFQANSRVITTSDEMIQELLSMKR